MATSVMMRHPATGLLKKGFHGFSWTTLFFGGLPALFRGDFIFGLAFLALAVLTCNVSSLILAFIYNKQYTSRLIEAGYEFADTEERNARARSRIGMTLPGPPASFGPTR